MSQSDRKPNPPKTQGIETNFNSIKEYLHNFTTFITSMPVNNPEEKGVDKVIETINKDIGPSSLEILTYLRPEAEDGIGIPGFDDEQSVED